MPSTAKDNAAEFSRLRWSFTRQKTKDRLLQDTLDLLRLLPETKAMLALAAAQNIDIRFNEKFIGTDDSGVTVVNRTTGMVHIELKPYRAPEDIAPALIHELRHVWQNHALGLTPRTMARGEPDARAALLLTRVKEADAYAYTDLAIARINNAIEALAEGGRLERQLLKENGGKSLSQQQEDEISDAIAARLSDNLDAEKRLAAAKFIKALTWLDSYDREALAAYHDRYTHPFHEPLEHPDVVLSLADIRKLTTAGEGPTAISYLDHLDDRAFVTAVFRDVKPELLETANLMASFEKAATPEKRKQLDDTLRKALKPAP
jgi:hypothetical protein